MKLLNQFKKQIPRLPYAVGNLIAKVPWGWRPVIGTTFAQRQRDIYAFDGMSDGERRSFIFDRVRRITRHAFENVAFYQEHYRKHDFHPDQLKDFHSIGQIPTIKKSDLLAFDIEQRSFGNGESRILANTAGSTGSPLSFYIQPDSYGHEKSHMAHIWSKLGYRQTDAVLSFNGRSKFETPVQYDALRHAFFVDIYKPFEVLASHVEQLFRSRRMPRFLHGYPSALYEFLTQIEQDRPELAKRLQEHTDGVFFGSEFPNPYWRKKIEAITDARSVSWYGHTERCILAYEREIPFHFAPMHTYGYAESVETEFGEQLIGTSYYNFYSPFIRYNTEDGIKAIEKQDGLLHSFEIVDGRVGEFVTDRKGKRIPLTGLIYGRHHELFNHCRSIQVSQAEPGKATIHYCVSSKIPPETDAAELFDSSKVEIEFRFQACQSPIRTAAGKIGLLVKPLTEPLTQTQPEPQ